MISDYDDCILCRLARRELELSIVYEDDTVLAIMDIQPVNPGHLIVFPKEHSSYLADLDPGVGAHMFKIAMKASKSLRRSSVRCDGVNLFLADGVIAGQEIHHVHLHVIPRFEGDGFGFKFDESYFDLPDRLELDEVASKIAFT